MAVVLRDVWVRLGGREIIRGATAEFNGQSQLVGPNGSGKTVLLYTIAGLVKPFRGEVEVSGTVSIMFQDPDLHFFAGTVLENALVWSGGRSTEAEVAKMANDVGIGDVLHRSPFELNWGHRKLAALLCALAKRPDVLLLDEPLEGLSPRFHTRVLTAAVEHSKTVVITTHMVVGGWKLYFMEEGQLYVGEEAKAKAVEHGYLQ